MGKINILSQELINQIAAGEVVERPASVVKELVENSFDAGATEIIVEVENGGLKLIKVTDNGCGMDREDAQKSVLQHATSKLQTEEDLYQIKSLGFRGEALASISSVSEFSLVTKPKEAVAGTSIEIVNSEVKVGDAGCAEGTSVSIKNLFYNVPARQKYLKTVVTEFNHIVDLFLNYCLAFPHISWRLVHNNRPVYHFPITDLEQRISDVLGTEVAQNLIPVDIKLNEIHLKGFIGKPQIARNNRKLQYLFVNERPVNEFIVAKQIKDAFATLIAKDLFPVYILNLQISNEKVDVNVHPRKLEVRFSEPQIVYRTVYQAISRTLDEHDLVRSVNVEEAKRFVPIKDVLPNVETQKFASQGEHKTPQTPFSRPSKIKQAMEFTKTVAERPTVETQNFASREKGQISQQKEGVPFKILAQVQNSYILVETEKGIKIYDQHASSERVQYEKIKNQWQIGRLASQKMLLPRNVELAPGEARAITENQEFLEKIGFDLSELSANTFAVSSVPQFLVDEDLKPVLIEIIGKLQEAVVLEDQIPEPIDDIFKMMACKSAIKFGDPLSNEGMEALIKDLESLGNQYTCVHGRPCVMEFTFTELEKMFKRN